MYTLPARRRWSIRVSQFVSRKPYSPGKRQLELQILSDADRGQGSYRCPIEERSSIAGRCPSPAITAEISYETSLARK